MVGEGKPRFRRGIKLGRIVRIRESKTITIRKGARKGTQKLIMKTIGYKDKKTGKVLKPEEVSSYKEYKKAQLIERLSKLPEHAPQRLRRDKETQRIVDRITGAPASREAIQQSRRQIFSQINTPLFPAHLRKAAETVSRRKGYDYDWTLERIRQWWIRYNLSETIDEKFPFSRTGSDFIGTERQIRYRGESATA